MQERNKRPYLAKAAGLILLCLALPAALLRSPRHTLVVNAAGTAGLVLAFDDNGSLTITTYGKKATTGIRYDTIGWTIKRYDAPISASNPSARLKVETAWEEMDPNNPGYEYGHFIVSADSIYDKIRAASPEWAETLYKNGGIVYLDGILTIEEYGVAKGGMYADGRTWGEVYFTYETIASARGWSHPEDLRNYFNHGVLFPAVFKSPTAGDDQIVITGLTPAQMANQGIYSTYATAGGYDLSRAIPGSEYVTTAISLPAYNFSAVLTHHYGKELKATDKKDYAGNPIYEEVPYDFYTLDELSAYELIGSGYSESGLFGGGGSLSYAGSSGASSLSAAATHILSLSEGWESVIRTYNAGVGRSIYSTSRQILPETANGSYTLTWTPMYRKITYITGGRRQTTYGGTSGLASAGLSTPRLAQIKVHTPVVAKLEISDEKAWNQQYTPTELTSLLLARAFTVNASAEGSHLSLPGYGSRDYSKYAAKRQVRFPFDVYIAEGQGVKLTEEAEEILPDAAGAEGTYVRQGSWVTLTELTTFTIPSYVACGDYVVESRSIAINNRAVEEGETEENANLSEEHTIATDTHKVNVSGRIFGFTITEVVDYPRWEGVFLNGFSYAPGIKDQDGEALGLHENQVLPILLGSHPNLPNLSAVGLGYREKFSFTSYGDFANEEANVIIEPQFYWVDENFEHRQRVKLYYEKDERLILVGSEEDLSTLRTTEVQESYTFGRILLTKASRTDLKDRQIWQGEYYLPTNVKALPYESDLEELIAQKGGYLGMENSAFLRKGFLIVRMELCVRSGSKPILLYGNYKNAEQGYCNMWKTEDLQTRRSWKNGFAAEFIYGDVMVFDRVRGLNEDYKVYGKQ